MTYPVVIRAEYFPILLPPLCHPMALFRITQFLLGQEDSDDLSQGQVEKLVESMMDKVTWIHLQLESMYGAGLLEMSKERFYMSIWEQFKPVGLDEEDRVLNAISVTTYQLDLGL